MCLQCTDVLLLFCLNIFSIFMDLKRSEGAGERTADIFREPDILWKLGIRYGRAGGLLYSLVSVSVEDVECTDI